jgi:hypothetical protein
MRSFTEKEILERYAELREEQERYKKLGIGSTTRQTQRVNNIIQICSRRGYIHKNKPLLGFQGFLKTVTCH